MNEQTTFLWQTKRIIRKAVAKIVVKLARQLVTDGWLPKQQLFMKPKKCK